MDAVVGAVVEAVSSPAWSSRAAGLLFTQYFWFRQCFLFSGDHLALLKVRRWCGCVVRDSVEQAL